MLQVQPNNANLVQINPPVNEDNRVVAIIKKVAIAVRDFFVWVIGKIVEALTWATDKIANCCSYSQGEMPGDPQIANPAPPADVPVGPVPAALNAADPAIQQVIKDLQLADDEALAKKLQGDLDPAASDEVLARAMQDEEQAPKAPIRAPQNIFNNIFNLFGQAYGPEEQEDAVDIEFHQPAVIPLNRDLKVVYKPVAPEPLAKEGWINAAAMKKRQEKAIERLDQLTGTKKNFELNANVLEFDLDEVLSKYCASHSTFQYLDLFDLANTDKKFFTQDQRDNFEAKIVKEYPIGDKKELPKYKAVRENLSRLSDLLNGKIKKVQGNKEQEDAVKQQIRNIITRLIDASNDCIDQVDAQLGHILIETISSESAAGEATPQDQLMMKAAALLYQYKLNLITASVQRLNTESKHQADVERAVMQVVAPFMGLKAKSNELGAQFDTEMHIPNKEKTIEEAKAVVLRRYNNDPSYLMIYKTLKNGTMGDLDRMIEDLWNDIDEKPLSYLTRGAIAPEQYNPVDKLRSSLIEWASAHFDLESEGLAEQITEKASDGGTFTFAEGGNFSQAGLLWILESAGIIQEVK